MSDKYPGAPRWAKLTGVIALAMLVLLIVLLVAGIGGPHGPGRHLPGARDTGAAAPREVPAPSK